MVKIKRIKTKGGNTIKKRINAYGNISSIKYYDFKKKRIVLSMFYHYRPSFRYKIV